MADNYMQFAIDLEISNPRALAWVNELLSFADAHEGEDDALPDSGLAELLKIVHPGWDEMPYLGFSWGLDGTTLYINDGDGQGNTDTVVAFLASYLRLWADSPDETIGFEFCWSCSKPRAGEFGGGACVVSATQEKWWNSAQFIEENTAPAEAVAQEE